MARSFVDTNLLLYCDGRADPRKHAIALEHGRACVAVGEGVLSIQV